MEKKIICPLCNNENLEVLEKINTKDIIDLWQRKKNDTSKLFQNIAFLKKYKCHNCGLIFFDPIVSGDNNFYSKLSEEQWYYLHEGKTEFGYSNDFIKENDRVLDIGSGIGAFVKQINKKISYIGLELNSRAVELAAKENINVVEATIEDFVIKTNEFFDVIVVFQVLEHITNIESFISSSLRALKVDGLLIIAVPNNDTFIKDAQNNLLNMPPHHQLLWNEKSLEYLAEKFNLEIIDIFKEKVTSIHKIWFYSVVISRLIRTILGINSKSINTHFFIRAINNFSYLVSRFLRIFMFNPKKDGHTIVIVLKKSLNV